MSTGVPFQVVFYIDIQDGQDVWTWGSGFRPRIKYGVTPCLARGRLFFRRNDGDGTLPTATGEFYIDMQDVQDWRLGWGDGNFGKTRLFPLISGHLSRG